MPDITRRADGTFSKGQTGNPGGRPSIPGDVREALELGSLAAAQRLVALVGSEDERVALAASEAILNLLYGRAPQALEVTAEAGPALDPAEVASRVLAALEIIHSDTN